MINRVRVNGGIQLLLSPDERSECAAACVSASDGADSQEDARDEQDQSSDFISNRQHSQLLRPTQQTNQSNTKLGINQSSKSEKQETGLDEDPKTQQ